MLHYTKACLHRIVNVSIILYVQYRIPYCIRISRCTSKASEDFTDFSTQYRDFPSAADGIYISRCSEIDSYRMRDNARATIISERPRPRPRRDDDTSPLFLSFFSSLRYRVTQPSSSSTSSPPPPHSANEWLTSRTIAYSCAAHKWIIAHLLVLRMARRLSPQWQLRSLSVHLDYRDRPRTPRGVFLCLIRKLYPRLPPPLPSSRFTSFLIFLALSFGNWIFNKNKNVLVEGEIWIFSPAAFSYIAVRTLEKFRVNFRTCFSSFAI